LARATPTEGPGPIWDRELVLVTGKGGGGKTTLTAALGLGAQRAGRRVLVAEITPDLHTTSPLLGHFGRPDVREEEPVRLDDRLYGVRIAPQTGHRMFLRAGLKVKLLVDTAMRSAALTRFLMAAPTFPEVGILYQIVELLRSRRFDHILIDLPATGHALALASLPRVVNRIVPSGLIGDAIREGLECLTDRRRCWTAIATLPESLPVTETVELTEALGRCDIAVGAAVLNRIPDDPFSDPEWTALRAHLAGRTGPLLGSRELTRLERAHRARDSFHRVIPAPTRRYEVPVFDAPHDRAIIEAMAVQLAGDAGRIGEQA
jgi:arsenite-transporting ATPase